MGKIVGSVIFPGLGHLLSGRYLKGAVLAVLFSITAEVLLLSLIWPQAFGESWPVFGALAVVIWGYAVLSHWSLLRRSRRNRKAGQADQVLLAGIKAMLRGDLGSADEAFRTVLRLDDRDVEGWLYLARTCQLRGQVGRARRFYRVVRRLDRQRKWAWELELLSGVRDVSRSDTTP